MARGKTKADLEREIADLQEENVQLQDQLVAAADIVAPDDGDDADDDDAAMMMMTWITTTRTDRGPPVWASGGARKPTGRFEIRRKTQQLRCPRHALQGYGSEFPRSD